MRKVPREVAMSVLLVETRKSGPFRERRRVSSHANKAVLACQKRRVLDSKVEKLLSTD